VLQGAGGVAARAGLLAAWLQTVYGGLKKCWATQAARLGRFPKNTAIAPT
jgi:hypothetical protein